MYHINNGQWFCDGFEDVFSIGDKLGIAYSEDSTIWTIHKHGDPNKVRMWFEMAKKTLSRVGAKEIANEIKYVEFVVGSVDLKEINHAFECSGYIQKIIQGVNNGNISV